MLFLCFMEKKRKLLHDCTYIGLSHVCILVHQARWLAYFLVEAASVLSDIISIDDLLLLLSFYLVANKKHLALSTPSAIRTVRIAVPADTSVHQ